MTTVMAVMTVVMMVDSTCSEVHGDNDYDGTEYTVFVMVLVFRWWYDDKDDGNTGNDQK